jgi:hypothetical protein
MECALPIVLSLRLAMELKLQTAAVVYSEFILTKIYDPGHMKQPQVKSLRLFFNI